MIIKCKDDIYERRPAGAASVKVPALRQDGVHVRAVPARAYWSANRVAPKALNTPHEGLVSRNKDTGGDELLVCLRLKIWTNSTKRLFINIM